MTPQDNKFTIQKAALKATDFNILVSYTTVGDGQSYTAYMNEQSPDSPLVLFYGDTITGYKIIPYADAADKPAAYTAAVMGNYDVLDDNGNKIGTGSGTPTKPGHYRLSIRVTADANHYVASELQSENWVLDIWRAPLYISDFTVTEPDLTYDGSAKAVTVTNNSEKDYGEITVTYRNDPYNSDGAVLDGAPVEPGVYFYTVNAAGGALHAGGLVASGSFRIREAGKPDPDPKPEPEPDPKPEPEPAPAPDSTDSGLLDAVTIVAGSAALYAGIGVVGYEAVTYSILAELLPKGTPIPTTREELAVLVWNTAGKPESAAPAVYSDVAEPETAKAARWAVEAGLLPDMGEGAFMPGKRVTKVQVIRALNRLKKLGLAK